jgi:hypothetical protein
MDRTRKTILLAALITIHGAFAHAAETKTHAVKEKPKTAVTEEKKKTENGNEEMDKKVAANLEMLKAMDMLEQMDLLKDMDLIDGGVNK